jgi:hypothetical protein
MRRHIQCGIPGVKATCHSVGVAVAPGPKHDRDPSFSSGWAFAGAGLTDPVRLDEMHDELYRVIYITLARWRGVR